MIKKDINIAWTRDFTLPWAQWWSRDMNPRLVEVVGVGVPNQLSYFNGRLLETYRLVEESQAFIQAVVNADSEVLSKVKTDRYIELIRQMRKLLKSANKNKNFTDKTVFEKLKIISAEAYPWYTISYLLPQDQWAGTLKEKYPKEASQILARLIDARKKSEGAIEEMVEYWRSAAKGLLETRKLPVKFAPFLLFDELEQMFENKNYAPDKKQLEHRSKGYIFFKDTVYTGVSKDDFFKNHGFVYVAEKIEASKGIKGMVSCMGPASIKGIVQIILKNEEVKNFKPGNILVTVMTNPFFVPIMKKAAAIVTDEGGITCHAAIVSRELNIPCITGTKHATKALKDGDRIEVDAVNGIVKKL